MRKIIEIGNIFKARCPKCNCLFQYEKEDIKTDIGTAGYEYSMVKCPQCDTEIAANGRLDVNAENAKLSKEERFMRGDFFTRMPEEGLK